MRIPAFPHAHTQGDDLEDALANAREIIELEIFVAVERGEDQDNLICPNRSASFAASLSRNAIAHDTQ